MHKFEHGMRRRPIGAGVCVIMLKREISDAINPAGAAASLSLSLRFWIRLISMTASHICLWSSASHAPFSAASTRAALIKYNSLRETPRVYQIAIQSGRKQTHSSLHFCVRYALQFCSFSSSSLLPFLIQKNQRERPRRKTFVAFPGKSKFE